MLTRHWRKLGLTLDNAGFTDQAVTAIARITGGNFCLIRLTQTSTWSPSQ